MGIGAGELVVHTLALVLVVLGDAPVGSAALRTAGRASVNVTSGRLTCCHVSAVAFPGGVGKRDTTLGAERPYLAEWRACGW